MDREAKTNILVFKWMQEGGILQGVDDIYKSIRRLVQSIYDHLPDEKLDELYEFVDPGDEDETVPNNDNTNSNQDI